jgi:ABC-type amino acid transport substrate-binding protein
LISGSLDAAIVDHVTALDATQNTPGVHILPEMISEEPYVIASRTEDKALIDAIDDILSQLENNGTLQRLTERWIQNLH